MEDDGNVSVEELVPFEVVKGVGVSYYVNETGRMVNQQLLATGVSASIKNRCVRDWQNAKPQIE